ncbi:hypothetical protein [Methyloprofundus sp.]|uniref:hypothetical protein n=1 Tax=Methyloprofundus sp. TaxID=2020875 RepID=UPI003D0D9A2F
MKHKIIKLSLLAVLATSNVQAADKVSDEASLMNAIEMANADSSIHKIVFEKNSQIDLTSAVIYTGSQDLAVLGNGSTISGAAIGDGDTLTFITAGNISIQKLAVVDSTARGVVVEIPADAEGDDIQVSLHKVKILRSALYGLHIDDNADELDDGEEGSAIGIELNISHSSFIANGTGAIDYDGVRVDERADGDIHATISHTHIDGNGGDGIELDEAGDGDVDVTMRHVTLNGNGFFNEEDLDDGFDIDEAGAGDVIVSLFKVEAKDNQDEGLDFDEAGAGNVKLKLRKVVAMNNFDEGIKVDEEDAGNIEAKLFKVVVQGSGDDGIQFTELGEGRVEAELKKVSATENAKYGVKIEQWDIEDEGADTAEKGALKVKNLTLDGNGKGDELILHNIIVE